MIILDNLVVGYYGHGVSPVINGCIKKGNITIIVGANGVGKSTFLQTLAGFLLPISGNLKFGKLGIPNIGYLPQIKKLDYHYPLTVFDVVSMGCWPKISMFSRINGFQRGVILRVLKKLKLLHLLNKYIQDLSSGQFQCMLFARILVQQASIILLDEPFQGIDTDICSVIVQAINQLCKNGCTVVIVLHNDVIFNKYVYNKLILTNSCSSWQLS